MKLKRNTVSYLVIKSNFIILFIPFFINQESSLSETQLRGLTSKFISLCKTLTLRLTTACLLHHIMNHYIHRFETPQLAALPHFEIHPSACDKFLSSVRFIKFIRPIIIRFPSMLPLISRWMYYSLKFKCLCSDSF